MMYESIDNSSKAWSDDLLQPLIDVRAAYCKRHGYVLLDANGLIDRTRPAAWSKLLAFESYFKSGQYDYLFYLDMDTLIMNPSIKLETLISAARADVGSAGGDPPDMIISEDMNGLNTGSFIMRNSEWSLWFLRTAWEQEQLVGPTAADGTPHLFRWEQRAFHYLTYSAQWQQAGLPKFPGDIEGIRRHISVLPQCAFNSYILHPFDWHAVREDAQYAPGDFLIHFAGKNGESKRTLMRYYLDQLRSQGGQAGAVGRRLSADSDGSESQRSNSAPHGQLRRLPAAPAQPVDS